MFVLHDSNIIWRELGIFARLGFAALSSQLHFVPQLPCQILAFFSCFKVKVLKYTQVYGKKADFPPNPVIHIHCITKIISYIFLPKSLCMADVRAFILALAPGSRPSPIL